MNTALYLIKARLGSALILSRHFVVTACFASSRLGLKRPTRRKPCGTRNYSALFQIRIISYYKRTFLCFSRRSFQRQNNEATHTISIKINITIAPICVLLLSYSYLFCFSSFSDERINNNPVTIEADMVINPKIRIFHVSVIPPNIDDNTTAVVIYLEISISHLPNSFFISFNILRQRYKENMKPPNVWRNYYSDFHLYLHYVIFRQSCSIFDVGNA